MKYIVFFSLLILCALSPAVADAQCDFKIVAETSASTCLNNGTITAKLISSAGSIAQRTVVLRSSVLANGMKGHDSMTADTAYFKDLFPGEYEIVAEVGCSDGSKKEVTEYLVTVDKEYEAMYVSTSFTTEIIDCKRIGKLALDILGGKAPYTVRTTDEDGNSFDSVFHSAEGNTVVVSKPGKYSFNVIDACNTSSTISEKREVPAFTHIPLSAQFNAAQNRSCTGDGFIILNIHNGGSPYNIKVESSTDHTFLRMFENHANSSLQVGEETNGLKEGNYVFTITDRCNSTVVIDTDIEFVRATLPVTVKSYTSCNNLNGGFSFEINDKCRSPREYTIETTAAPSGFSLEPQVFDTTYFNISGLPAGQYSFTITDANNSNPVYISGEIQAIESYSGGGYEPTYTETYESYAAGLRVDGRCPPFAYKIYEADNPDNPVLRSERENVMELSELDYVFDYGIMYMAVLSDNGHAKPDTVFFKRSVPSCILEYKHESFRWYDCWGYEEIGIFDKRAEAGTRIRFIDGPTVPIHRDTTLTR
ncbi:MAG: hypothetical protein LBD35_07010, partial [Prevotellaceae bacterium]|nr:hypothetical protein [Prevotellaceae bacterium]